MRRECWEHFSRHRLQRTPLVNDPDMHHGTCVTHVPWCLSGSLIRGDGENVPGIPGACATRNVTYLLRGPWCEASPNFRSGIACQKRRKQGYAVQYTWYNGKQCYPCRTSDICLAILRSQLSIVHYQKMIHWAYHRRNSNSHGLLKIIRKSKLI